MMQDETGTEAGKMYRLCRLGRGGDCMGAVDPTGSVGIVFNGGCEEGGEGIARLGTAS